MGESDKPEQEGEHRLKVIILASVYATDETAARDALGRILNKAIASVSSANVTFTAYRVLVIDGSTNHAD